MCSSIYVFSWTGFSVKRVRVHVQQGQEQHVQNSAAAVCTLSYFCVCVLGGAGGKGVWGTPGEVYDEEEVDVRDPNYDEDQVGDLHEHLGT